jgi:alpha,alpha-trehalase
MPKHTESNQKLLNHISKMWSELERFTPEDTDDIIGLPKPYIVPGGKFNEQFYWDSYFTMLGLASDNRWEMVENMIANTASLINRFGFVPTANRYHYLSRSQPPVFSLMVELLAKHKGKSTLTKYLPQMKKEYAFWMDGLKELKTREHKSFARLAQMPDGSLLNRYYDNLATPRKESALADIALSDLALNRQSDRLFLHLRAAAESGWDFSSRWCVEPQDLDTIHTADIIPIDLNCLLYHLEQTIAKASDIAEDTHTANDFNKKANDRAQAIHRYCWHENQGFFFDYNFHHQESTVWATVAAVFPLFVGIASQQQADQVANKLKQEFLQEGGLLTTLEQTGQQWDKPNGWAPMQWVAIEGLKHYEHTELAKTIKERWLSMNQNVYQRTGKLIEKYDVTPGDNLGFGGEYPLQEGFGWTNSIFLALYNQN